MGCPVRTCINGARQKSRTSRYGSWCDIEDSREHDGESETLDAVQSSAGGFRCCGGIPINNRRRDESFGKPYSAVTIESGSSRGTVSTFVISCSFKASVVK